MGLLSLSKALIKASLKRNKTRRIFQTEYDVIVDVVKEHGKIYVKELARFLKYDVNELEKITNLLVKHDILKVNYPLNVFSEPTLSLGSYHKKKIHCPVNAERVLNTYEINADYVKARVRIVSRAHEDINTYHIQLPEVGVGSEALLEELKNELVDSLDFLNDEIVDSKKFNELKKRFIDASLVFIKEKLPKDNEDTHRTVAGLLLHQMYGLGDVDVMMSDDFLEEIVINNSQYPLVVYHKMYGWMKTSKMLENELEIFNLASQIGRKANRQINSLSPIMDAQLFSGDRVAATLFPISMMGHTITLRKFSRSPWTIAHYVSKKYNLMSYEMAALLWIATQYELNVLVAGSTASGKTSIMNALNVFIPTNQRVISIEDTKELFLPRSLHWNWVPLLSRGPNQDGKGGVSMLDLMIASLRMRPDRIIVGEVRKRKQVETMFEAMTTGHSVYATMHADTVEQVKRRLIEPPIEIPKEEVESLQLVLVQFRDRRKGLRRTLELAEVLTGGEKTLETNYLYRWLPRTDVFEKVNESIRVFEDLNLHTGMTPKEIKDDLKERADILQWMLDNNIKNIDQVGKIMRVYYKNKDVLLDFVNKQKKPDSSLLGEVEGNEQEGGV